MEIIDLAWRVHCRLVGAINKQDFVNLHSKFEQYRYSSNLNAVWKLIVAQPELWQPEYLNEPFAPKVAYRICMEIIGEERA